MGHVKKVHKARGENVVYEGLPISGKDSGNLSVFLFLGGRSEFATGFLFLSDVINYHVNITSVLLLIGSLSRVIPANKQMGKRFKIFTE